ncbi:sodium-dependent phosphate transporter 1-like isoform X2 [Gordionus sp. m RMFG-2023]|uniref:sodium-dependent phosphate transporter 1-like isoform X2 n=1 Tax=Gordionus sp. m RMFG-2023 TaxID=3053472 RepID=UPI0031FCFC52
MDYLWAVILGFVIAMILAFGIGANDVANSFGTSVGSKVLTIFQACVIATIFETLGAVLIGGQVSNTIRKGIIDVDIYNGSERLLIAGEISALMGSAVWLILATFLKLPVSASHSIVGSTLGFSLVAKGHEGIHWEKLGYIVASWFVSPLFSGIISGSIFLLIRKFVLNRNDSLKAGLRVLPYIYAITCAVNLFSIFYNGPKVLKLDQIPTYGSIILTLGSGLLIGIGVQFLLVPWYKKRISENIATSVTLLKESGRKPSDGPAVSSISTSPKPSLVNHTSKGVNQMAKVIDITDLGTDQDVIDAKLSNQKKSVAFCELPARERKLSDADKLFIGYLLPGDMQKFEEAVEVENEEISTNGNISSKVNVLENAIVSPKTPKHNVPAPKNRYAIAKIFGGFFSRKKTLDKSHADSIIDSKLAIPLTGTEDNPHGNVKGVSKLFSFLQILTGAFGAFAHGGNDVSNSIGPLIALWEVSKTGSVAQIGEPPLWILLYGGLGISIGLWLFGQRVMETMGKDLTTITPRFHH